ncbi:MAG: hypothetical protein PUA78_08460, partial [Porphyromonadaceae bacterium]|nr:hypothetical protein [Porphyromonadaceae bacterium]
VRLHSKIANFFVTQRKYEILSLNLQRHLRSIGLSELASDTLSETLPMTGGGMLFRRLRRNEKEL